MSKLKFELFITNNEEQKIFEIIEKPIIFGSAANCDVQVGDSEPKIKAVIQREDDHLLAKIYDTQFPIILNNKKYKTAKIKKSVFFKIGDVDIIVNIEELEGGEPEVVSHSFKEGLPDYIDDTLESVLSQKIVSELELPSIHDKPDTQRSLAEIPIVNKGISQEDKSRENSEREDVLPLNNSLKGVIKKDYFSFSIVFDESVFEGVPLEQCLKPVQYDYSSYIDIKDETVVELPTPEVHFKKETQSLHIIYLNSGVVLGEKFFKTNIKRLYLSQSFNEGSYFQVEDCGSEKLELLYTRKGTTFIVALEGYKAYKFILEDVVEQTESTFNFLEGEKVLFCKGTSQIIIEITPTPAKVKTDKFFNVDEGLLKSLSISWAFCLLVLAVVVAFPPVDELKTKRELVIIYKREKIEKVVEENIEKSDLLENIIEKEKSRVVEAELENPTLEKKKQLPKKSASEPPPVLAKTKKLIETKRQESLKRKKRVREVAKPSIAKKSTPLRSIKRDVKIDKVSKKIIAAPVKEKQYKFSFGSKTKSLMNSISKTNLRSAKNTKSAHSKFSINSTSRVTSKFNSEKFGVSSSKASRFVAGTQKGGASGIGTKGLSKKTRMVTAYMAANTKILGALDPALVRKIMNEYIPQFRHCYQRELIRNPSVMGRFDVSFQVNSKGRGIRVGVKSKENGFSKKGKTCLGRVVKLIRFPKPKGGGLVDVKQPMNFYRQ